MKRFLAPAFVMFPLLGGVPTEVAIAAPNGHPLLINQTEDATPKIGRQFDRVSKSPNRGANFQWFEQQRPDCPSKSD
jgi:hypothetical protein